MGRLNPKSISDDLQTLDAIEAMSDYAPPNTDFSKTALNGLKQAMQTKRATETVKAGEAAAARDEADAAERAFHEAVTGARVAVKAQYGKDSNELQSAGMKKASEIVRGRRKTTATKTGG